MGVTALPSPLFSSLQAALGTQYTLERELGSGGMGVVFLAHDTTLHRPVAVKVVHPELAVHSSITQRFLAEARLVARLRHPNIVSIHSAGETTGLFWYVMDFVPGESLRQRMLREERMDPEVVARIVGDLADALHAAGQAGVVHRDVKPENVLLDAMSGRALLADFGIARAMAPDGSGSITGQGLAIGTPTYMSPEQATGERVDSRSDIYSLGVVAYEMLTGRPPFQAVNGAAVISMHLAERPAPIQALRPETPPHLAAAVMRALAKDPAERWETGAEFREAVTGSGAGGRPPAGTATTPTAVRRRRSRGPLVAVMLVLVLTVGTMLVARGRTGPPEGANPRHSILVLPFENLRQDPTLDWLRDGSVNMLALNLSQWNDLTVVDHERLHDLLAKYEVHAGDPIGLALARRLARDAGVWTVVLGDFARSGDSLHLAARVFDVASGSRVDAAQVDAKASDDVRPLYDELASRILDLSGAPGGIRTDLVRATTSSLEAFRAYLAGIDKLNRWDLAAADQDLRRAVAMDTTFGLAYYELALTRGWIAGESDSVGRQAIYQASRLSERLPPHEQTMIRAYRAFIDQDRATARALYQQLLAKDPTDAAAWYGLGDAWFHDTSLVVQAAHQHHTQALRAFKRAIALDPDYFLAYEHLNFMLRQAAQADPPMVLLPDDSFAVTRSKDGRTLLDSVTIARAVLRARSEAVTTARNWVSAQPGTARAYTALIDAYAKAQDYPAALAELKRLQGSPAGSGRADLPFVEAGIQFQAGQRDAAEATVKSALDSLAGRKPDLSGVALENFGRIPAAANIFLYGGRLHEASRLVNFSDAIRTEILGYVADPQAREDGAQWRRLIQSHLYAAAGGPVDVLRDLWRGAAEAARLAPAAKRESAAQSAWPAAIALFSLTADPGPLKELQGLTGQALPPEVEALLAISHDDTARARRLLNTLPATPADHPTDGWVKRITWPGYRSALEAQGRFLLGDYQGTLRALEKFEPKYFETETLDPRWGLLGRVRLLRGSAYEKLGQLADARREYQTLLDEWRNADPELQPFVNQARIGLARAEASG